MEYSLTLFCCSRSSCSFICSSMTRDSPCDTIQNGITYTHTHTCINTHMHTHANTHTHTRTQLKDGHNTTYIRVCVCACTEFECVCVCREVMMSFGVPPPGFSSAVTTQSCHTADPTLVCVCVCVCVSVS